MEWQGKTQATLPQLRSLLGKLLYVAQVRSPIRLFLNRPLEALRICPLRSKLNLDTGFHEGQAWFSEYLPKCNGIFMMVLIHGPKMTYFVTAASQGVEHYLWINATTQNFLSSSNLPARSHQLYHQSQTLGADVSQQCSEPLPWLNGYNQCPVISKRAGPHPAAMCMRDMALRHTIQHTSATTAQAWLRDGSPC